MLSFRLKSLPHLGQPNERGVTCCVSMCRIKTPLREKIPGYEQSFQLQRKASSFSVTYMIELLLVRL